MITIYRFISITVTFIVCGLPLLHTSANARSLFDRPGALDVFRDVKPWMDKKGIKFEMVYTGEVFSNFSGGKKQTDALPIGSDPEFYLFPTRYLDNLALKLTVDFGKANLWANGKIFIHALSNAGDDPTDYVGDIQATSNIEANNTTRLFELWYEHTYFRGGMTVLFGLHDLNSEFYITEYGGLFLNSSFGVGPDLSLNVPVSIFNVGAPGVIVKLRPSRTLTYLAAVYDGDPGSADENFNGLKVTVDDINEGFLFIGEAQLGRTGEDTGFKPNSIRVGAWYHTGRFQSSKARVGLLASQWREGNTGFYATADRSVFSKKSGREFGLFAQVGFPLPGTSDRNEVYLYLGGGVNIKSIFDSRPEDMAGIAVAYAQISDDLASAEKQAYGYTRSSEMTLELTYHSQIYPWFSLQPDYQIVINPGGRSDVNMAHIASIRFEIVF